MEPGHVTCSKERELGIMATQIKNIEVMVTKIDKKLDNVITQKADKTEVDKLRREMIERDAVQDKAMNFLAKNWFNILIVLTFIIYGILRSRGMIQ